MSGRTNKLIQNKQTTLLRDMQRTLTKMKAPQPVGGDILIVQGIPDGGDFYLSSITLLAGQTGYARYDISPANETLTLWNFGWTIYVDPTNFQSNGLPTSTFIWPTGSSWSSTSGQFNLSASGRLDWHQSSDDTNERVFILTVRNNDSVSHTYYIAARFYLPYLPGQ